MQCKVFTGHTRLALFERATQDPVNAQLERLLLATAAYLAIDLLACLVQALSVGVRLCLGNIYYSTLRVPLQKTNRARSTSDHGRREGGRARGYSLSHLWMQLRPRNYEATCMQNASSDQCSFSVLLPDSTA